MGQSFDTKRYEENMQREKRIRSLFSLPHDVSKNVLAILAHGADRSDIFPSCISCVHFESTDLTVPNEQGDITKDICKIFKVRPPAKIIANGCEKYDEDDIPF